MQPETRYLLNVGLLSNDGRCKITPGAVLHELYGVLDRSPVRILKTTTAQSGTEETLVVELGAAPSYRAVYTLSETLWQDCIACYDLETGEGELIGPAAAKWGAFDPALFLTPNGQPLGGNPADTADFSTYEKRVELSRLGVCSIDSTRHRAKRAAERAAGLRIEGAYRWLGLNRRAESSRIQSDVAGLLPEGIWPRSSKLYSSRMHALDRHVLLQAERLGYCS